MTDSVLYLDYNASTPLRPEAWAAMEDALRGFGNPSSVHRHGRRARRIIEDAREQVAALCGAEPAGVVFTSGGTEANALALRGSGRRRVLVSAVEHASVLHAVDHFEPIPVDRNGVVDLDAVDAMLAAAGEPAVVSVMVANNETGVVQPVAELAEIAHRHGALVHSDAVQACGKIPVAIADLGVDLLSVSAHKLGGPAGVGALVVGGEVDLAPLIRGGGQERGLRAGTENVTGIAGFAAAAISAAGELSAWSRVERLRDGLELRARAAVPGTRIFADAARRLPNTSCLAMPGVSSGTQVIALDLAGIAVSAGSACSSGTLARSHVLAAMGVSAGEADCAIRVSLGWASSERDVERFLSEWAGLSTRGAIRHPRATTAAWAKVAGQQHTEGREVVT
jgi:cysteine desulfurase